MNAYSTRGIQATSFRFGQQLDFSSVTMAETPRQYITARRVDHLLESLTVGLMYHRPVDHIGYLLDCLDTVQRLGWENVTWSTFLPDQLQTGLPPQTHNTEDTFQMTPPLPSIQKEDATIKLLLRQSNEQRQKVAVQYKASYDTNIHQEYKAYLTSVDIATTCSALTVAPANYVSRETQYYLQGAGDECALMEIICGRSKQEVQAIRETYQIVLGRDLVKDLQAHTGLVFQKLLLSDAQGQRQQSKDVDAELAVAEAHTLYEADPGTWGDDTSEFYAMLTARSHEQLKRTFSEYEALAGDTIEDAVRANMQQSYHQGCIELVTFIKDSLLYFGDRLYNSLKGSCHDESTLRRVIIYRSEVDMAYVRGTFEQKYKENLKTFIEAEAKADFKKILLLMIG